MARSKGSANLAASLEVLAGAPLDAREVVQAKTDLTAADSFPYKYIGMEVYVVAENKKYRLISSDPTDIESWQEIGSGGGGSSETTKSITAAVTVGGISAGTNYPVGTEIEDIISDLLESFTVKRFPHKVVE